MHQESDKLTPNRSVYRVHQNIMETLVSEEVAKQMRHLPKHLKGYLDPIDVATYALNRLPPYMHRVSKESFINYKLVKPTSALRLP